jgi:dihydrofolate reductase
MSEIVLVVAIADNGVIGKDGKIPWHISEDLKRFKALTMGHTVVMGRKTWDSLPPRFRPLPGRRNIVVTRQDDWKAEGAWRVGSLQEALALCEESQVPDVWIIGGAQIYAEAEPLAQQVVVTELAHDYEGDAHAPELSPSAWRETKRESHVSAKEGLNYSFVTYERIAPSKA